MQLVAMVAMVTIGLTETQGRPKMQSSQSALVCVCVCLWRMLVRVLLFPWRHLPLRSKIHSLLSSYQSCVSMLCGVTPTGVTCCLHFTLNSSPTRLAWACSTQLPWVLGWGTAVGMQRGACRRHLGYGLTQAKVVLSRDEKMYPYLRLQHSKTSQEPKISIDFHFLRICLCCSWLGIVQLWVWEPQLQRQVLPTDWEYTTHAAVFYLSLCLQCVRSHVINVWASVMIRMWWSSRLQPCSGWNCSDEYFFSSIKVGYNLWKCCLESFPSAFRQQITSSNYQTMCTGKNYLDGNFGFGFCSIRAITPIMSPLYA